VAVASLFVGGCPRDRSGADDDDSVDAGALRDAAPDAEQHQCLGRGQGPTASQPCACAADCDPDEACAAELDYGVPGGLCLHACESDDDCPDGTACDPTTGCQAACASTADCRAGYVCSRVGGAGPLSCLPLCQQDSDCPASGACDRYTGVCGDLGAHPGEGDLGAACASDAACRSAFCGQGSSFPGGYCSAFCSVSRQGCPAGGPCFANTADEGDDMGHCLVHCEDDVDCRMDEGYFCGYSAELPDELFCGTSG